MTKPLRENAGIALFNADGLVLIAHRLANDGPEVIEPGLEWQMPQGGIQAGEKPYDAAIRELLEETSVRAVKYLGETDWLIYEFPPYDGPPHYLEEFRGQRQKWFAFRFLGTDADIDVVHAEINPEFDCWRWEQLSKLPSLVVSFKRHIYRDVVSAFSEFG
jgi:putative (di)nucleoside polyphosphate hydrolase